MTTTEIKLLWTEHGRTCWTKFIPHVRDVLCKAVLPIASIPIVTIACAKAFRLGFMAGAAVATKKEERESPKIIRLN